MFAAGRVLQLDSFRKLDGFGWPGFSSLNLWRQDKGHKACAAAFVRAVEQGGAAPVSFDELMEVTPGGDRGERSLALTFDPPGLC